MSSLFRKRSEPTVAEDTIPEDLFAAIPDVEPTPAPRAGFEGFVASARGNARDADAASIDLHALVAQMRRQMDSTVARELDRVEGSIAGLVGELQERLATAQAELLALRRENEALSKKEAGYAKRFEMLRELTREVERG